MVLCGEPGCGKDFGTGRQRRRHIHKKHRPLPDICTECKNEPFLSDAARQQHVRDGHIKTIYNPGSGIALHQSSYSSVDSISTSFGNLSLSLSDRTRVTSQAPSHVVMTGTDLFDVDNTADLNRFITNSVQPDSHFLASCGEAIEELVNFLHHNAPEELRPTKVLKGGSLCKGTAVIGKSDVDLVVMIQGYADVKKLQRDMDGILDKLEDTLESFPNIESKSRTHRAVKVKVNKNGYPLEADILPAIDLLVEYAPPRCDVFEKMRGETNWIRGFYSPCLVPLQKKLFEQIPTEVKSLIRLVKYWKKEKLQGEEVVKRGQRRIKWPTSYPLELIVIDSWWKARMKARQPEQFDMTRALHSVLTSLVDHENYTITFPEHMFYSEGILKIERTPYIMDPCNPFNNVYYKGGYDWEAIAQKAAQWLRNPLFAGCSGTKYT